MKKFTRSNGHDGSNYYGRSRARGLNLGIPINFKAEKSSSVGIVGRLGTIKISARQHRRTKR